VAEILGVVNDDAPLNNKVPSVAAEYQSTVDPDGAVADKGTVPEPQREPAVPVGAEGTTCTVATTAALVEETQFVVVFFASA
jgi:hypothetical protein